MYPNVMIQDLSSTITFDAEKFNTKSYDKDQHSSSEPGIL